MTHAPKVERSARRGPLPPGPGSLHMVKVLLSLSRHDLVELAGKYGDPLTIPTPLGPMVTTISPEGNKAIFTTDPDTFVPSVADSLGAVLTRSVLFQHGADHRRARKLLAPPFHGARMRAYGKTIVDVTLHEASKLVRGKTFAMLDLTQSITLEVILRAIFGVEDDALRERFRVAIVELVAAMNTPIITVFEFTRKEFGGFGPWARFRRAIETLDALVYDEIKKRRGNTAGREDIFSMMLDAKYDDGEGMTDKELRDQLHLLFFAGHDTTSTSLAWAFYWTCRQPIEREKLMAEIDGLGDSPDPEAIVALPYLEAFCQETLRIYPVAPNVARQLTKPFNLLGNTIAEGTTLAASIMMLHENEKLYPEPRKFRPERFLERKFSPYEYIPFGGGPRRCIGAAFAMYELKIALATLLRQYQFRLVKDAPVKYVQRGLTMGPKGGIDMVIEGKR